MGPDETRLGSDGVWATRPGGGPDDWKCVQIHPGNAHMDILPRIRVRGKERNVCWRSLFLLKITNPLRSFMLAFVEWKWFDRFVLLLIFLNSVCDATYVRRANENNKYNFFVHNVAEPIFLIFFTAEMLCKIVAWGFILDRSTYLRCPWNWLDFTVVVSVFIETVGGAGGGLSCLRLLRILRPLRSLNSLPQMKSLVNTVVSSVPRLFDVIGVTIVLFIIFGSIGTSLFGGIFHRSCKTSAKPTLILEEGKECWSWPNVQFCEEYCTKSDGTNESSCISVGGRWKLENCENDRLCGGAYMCEYSSGFCGGAEDDHDWERRPVFDDHEDSRDEYEKGVKGCAPGRPKDEVCTTRKGIPWCQGSEPTRLNPETEFVNFDTIANAFLLIFQCMTMEGWTDLMYYAQDAHGFWVSSFYFFALIPATSFFLLNVALAVVDEAREDVTEDDGNEFRRKESFKATPEAAPTRQLTSGENKLASVVPVLAASVTQDFPSSSRNSDADIPKKSGSNNTETMMGKETIRGRTTKTVMEDPVPTIWYDCAAVRLLREIAFSPIFVNVVMFFIAANVVVMMMDQYPPDLALETPLAICEVMFLVVFCVEMIIMIGAMGPIAYVKSPVTCFDGMIVITSLVRTVVARLEGGGGSGPSAFTALRTLRLFRVLNKLANRSVSFRSLLLGMLRTASSLRYWTCLFALVLYIFSLMLMELFAKKMHFVDPNSFDKVSTDQGKSWCNGEEGNEDCIPRAHFDTFFWAIITVFQVMTGENWNTVMYAGLRSYEAAWRPAIAVVFMFLILFGQILFLSIFLSMLMSKFDEVSDQVREQEEQKQRFRQMRLDAEAKERRSTKKGKNSQQIPAGDQKENDDENQPADKEAKVEPIQNLKCRLDCTINGTEEKEEHVVAGWPKGYAWFVISESNPVRMAAMTILNYEVPVGFSVEDAVNFKVFDNFILVCIMFSSLGMAYDTPLNDPSDRLTKVVREADRVFAYIFIFEMAVKLVAWGLFWGKDAYLKSGWNWLDGIVVGVSVVGLMWPGTGGFLKTLRILRAFRPLRVISRNDNLKVVVQTMFASIPDLLTLIAVTGFFLLIFALFFLAFLNGLFYECSPPVHLSEGTAMLNNIPHFVTPLCLGTNASDVACPHGKFDSDLEEWIHDGLECEDALVLSSCPHASSLTPALSWKRASADTPICIGRCNPDVQAENPDVWNDRKWLCEGAFTSVQEFPSSCSNAESPIYIASMGEDEKRGRTLVSHLQRQLTMPCGGTTLDSTGKVVTPTEVSEVSCKSAFCPKEVDDETKSRCKSNCEIHPHFCIESCTDNLDSSACIACRSECEAQCHCEDFCTPLIKDAALCHEQGGVWKPSLSQNFDNIFQSFITLFEIMSTEGWVDVMYAAADSNGIYMQPRRDASLWIAPFFVVYVFFSFMFLLNLSVGVIVDNFMELKQKGTQPLLTIAQHKWLYSKNMLFSRAMFYSLTDLHKLEPRRRRVYNFISHRYFENSMMGAIVVNTCFMLMKVYPSPNMWWENALFGFDSFFTVVFALEFGIKFYALRSNYWKDRWNQFDFVCVAVTIVGTVMRMIPPVQEIGAVTSIIRIFRMGRLFHFFEGLHKIFTALMLSIPKLANVLCILLLLLMLFSILGVSLFSTTKRSETFNEHGNFSNFFFAFITLFRASTGEAWNELMRDLSKTEDAFRREGTWCAPEDLFNPSDADTWNVLNNKCLIDNPISCTPHQFYVAYIYWVVYTLIITYMVMNLVVAVILEGYEEGKPTVEGEVIKSCIAKWRKYDPDQTLKLEFNRAVQFISEMVIQTAQELGSMNGLISENRNCFLKEDIGSIKMGYGKMWTSVELDQDDMISFAQATKQVLRFTVASREAALGGEIKEGTEVEAIRAIECKDFLVEAGTIGSIVQIVPDGGDVLVRFANLGQKWLERGYMSSLRPLSLDKLFVHMDALDEKVNQKVLDSLTRKERRQSNLSMSDDIAIRKDLHTVMCVVKIQRLVRKRWQQRDTILSSQQLADELSKRDAPVPGKANIE